MIKIGLGMLLGAWLIIGSFALADKVATKRAARKERKAAKKYCAKCQEEMK